ncbi:MAG: chemotaxis protein CheA [Myxococcota bacterium]
MSENDYRAIFLSETRDHLLEIFTRLNNIDKTGKVDDEALFELFRRFHTLKGMANTMGLVEMGKLAHHLEELLEYIRKNPDMIFSLKEFIFKGVNSISLEIDNYEKGIPFESQSVISELDYVSKEIRQKIQVQTKRAEEKALQSINLNGLYETIFEVDKKSKTPSVRAFMLFKELMARVEICFNEPSIEQLRQGIRPEFIKIYTKEKIDEDTIKAIIYRVGEIRFIGSKIYRDEGDGEKNREVVKYIKVPFKRIEELTSSLDELLLLWNKYRYSLKDEEIGPFITRLEYGFKKVTNYAEHLRTVPVVTIVPKLYALVDTTAKAVNKSVRLVVTNEKIEIDKSIIDRIEEPLMHIIRNGISHGIEPVERRRELGKSDIGTIVISFEEEEEYICIRIRDDGRGMDREQILKTALERGLIKEIDKGIGDEDLLELVFIPGFSTLKTADMTSGRGFGMDIVRNVIWQMGGDVYISTEKDIGTEIILKIPYQFATKKVVIGEINGYRYAFPISAVRYLLNREDVKYSEDEKCIIRGAERFHLLNFQYKNPDLFIVCTDGKEEIAIGIDDIIFVGETRLYKVPYILKGSKFINGMVVIKGICPVPVLSVEYLINER